MCMTLLHNHLLQFRLLSCLMAAGLVVTSTTGEAKGNDELKAFFTLNNKLEMTWYDTLVEEGIDYSDLVDSAEDDLRDLLKECNLKQKAIIRIINAVRKLPHSTAYKKLKETQVSIVSTAEQEATLKIQKESCIVSDKISDVSTIMKTLEQKTKQCEKLIKDSFDNIVQKANKRKEELLQQLKTISETKYNNLLSQQNILKNRVKELDNFYNETQDMIKDTSMDLQKRKLKILSQTETILNKQVDSDVELIKDVNIEIKLDTKDISNTISLIGSVYDETGALPPMIKITKITFDSVTLTIESNEEEKDCIEHKIEYIEAISGNTLNNTYEKLEWQSMNVKAYNYTSESQLLLAFDNIMNDKYVKHVIKSLKRATKYMVRAASSNKNGWGMYSKSVSFETKDIDPKPFIAPFMVFDLYGTASSRMSIVPFSGNRKVKCLKGAVSSNYKCYGSSIRFKYGMPIEKKGNNKYCVSLISWEINHTVSKHFPNVYYFIGVISNRTKDLSMVAYKGLMDAYGISGMGRKVYKGKSIDGNSVDDSNYEKQYTKNSVVTVEYKIRESRLSFYSENKELYTMILPNDIDEITHWYPCVSLRDKDDICQISNNIIVK
eukprot:113359_1